MKKITTDQKHGLIILINMVFAALAINTSLHIFYVIGAIVATLTILYFLYIKLVVRKGRLFENLKIQHGIIILIIAAAFFILGHYKVNSVEKKMHMQQSEQGVLNNED